MSAKVFFVVSFLTEKRQPGLFSSQNGVTSKTFGWHFVFSSWLVVGFSSPVKPMKRIHAKKIPFLFMKSMRYIKDAIRLFRHQTQWVEPFSEIFYFLFYSAVFSREKIYC